MNNKHIKVFTDGASSGNPGPGGWGSIVATNSKVFELGGGEDRTTNNRMELKAVIESLKFIHKEDLKEKIAVYSDSAYVVKGATSWISGWKKNNWQTKQKTEVLNKDLWEELSDVLEKVDCNFFSLEGHVGIPANERADEIAVAFSKKQEIKLYSGSLSDYEVNLDETSPNGSQKQNKDRSKMKAYSYLSLVDGELEKHKTWQGCEERVKGKVGARFRKAISPEDELSIIKSWGLKV